MVGQGGLGGDMKGSTITECYNEGKINYNSVSNCVGGIVGVGSYNLFVNYCYNVAEINGRRNVGGVIGLGAKADIRYCYNKGTIQGTLNDIGGVAGCIRDFEAQSYTNNYLYYCYHFGKVTQNTSVLYVGTICGQLMYYDVDHCHSLASTSEAQWGLAQHFRSATDIERYSNKSAMISAMLVEFGSKFKTAPSSVNGGDPILSWQ